MGQTELGKVGRKDLFGRIEQNCPVHGLKGLGRKFLECRQHHEAGHCPAFYVDCPGAVNAIAFHSPTKIIAKLFIRRKDGVEMRDKADCAEVLAVSTRPAKYQVVPVHGIGRWNTFSGEAKFGEGLRRQRAQGIDPCNVSCEAVYCHHLPQKIQIVRQMTFEIQVEILNE